MSATVIRLPAGLIYRLPPIAAAAPRRRWRAVRAGRSPVAGAPRFRVALVCRHIATDAAMSRRMRRNDMTATATQAKSSTTPIDVAGSFFATYHVAATALAREVAATPEREVA